MTRPPIAILGLGCRMPQADGPEAFWKLLCEEVDAIVSVPADRWDAAALWSDDGRPGSTHCDRGGFIDGGDRFDAAFLGIGTAEAEAMDPQHGMVLEAAWQALEYAAIAPDSLRGSATGVFVGIGNSDFDRRLSADLRNLDARAGTGTSYSAAANRVSYVLGVHGPSMAVDLACSSSLAAVHLACQSLLLGECDLALAGGVHLMLGPEKTITCGRGLARDGRCKSFSAHADGYVRGEGCGMIVLKRLEDARRDRDPVLAVVRASAVGHNGRSNGLSAPLGAAQRRLVRQSLAAAGVSGASIGYVEAHATGTRLGDLIEVNALRAVLEDGRAAREECVIGSLKPNIGHLEAASGIAGVLKAICALGAGWIPKTLHTWPLNPELNLQGSALSIADVARPWPVTNSPRRALVCTQSFAGANANVLLEQPAPPEPLAPASAQPTLLVLSARTRAALIALAHRYTLFCRDLAADRDGFARFDDVCYTAAVGRAHFAYRLAIVATGAAEAADALESANLRIGTSRDVDARLVCVVREHGQRAAELLECLSECGMGPHIIRRADGPPDSIRVWAHGKEPPAEAPAVGFGTGELRTVLLCVLAEAYRSGLLPGWDKVPFGGDNRLPGLPTYAFERLRHRTGRHGEAGLPHQELMR